MAIKLPGPVRTAGVMALVVVAALGFPALLDLVRIAGHRIPQPEIEKDYLIGVLWALLLGASILLWPVPKSDKPALLTIWGAKCLTALGFMLLYEWYYELDAFWYFKLSLGQLIETEKPGWGQGTENLLVMTWAHSRILPDSYHAMKISFAMLGFVAVYLIYRGCARWLDAEDIRLLFVFALFPSILFWSSIIGKEPIQLFAIGLYGYGVTSWLRTHRATFLVPLVLGIALATFMRAWYGIIMVAPLLVVILGSVKGRFPRLIAFGGLLAACSWAVIRFATELRVKSLDDLATRANGLVAGLQRGSPEGAELVTFTDLGSVLSFLPVGAFAALFRPLPGEVSNLFGLIAGLENVLLLGLLVLSAARLSRTKLAEPLIQWAIAFVLVWTAFYAFVSYFNFGAAVRYRSPVLPILLGLLLYLSFATDRRSSQSNSAILGPSEPSRSPGGRPDAMVT